MTERIEEKDGSLFLRGVKHDPRVPRYMPREDGTMLDTWFPDKTPPLAKIRRERIATAVLAGFSVAYATDGFPAELPAKAAIAWADALIAELDKA